MRTALELEHQIEALLRANAELLHANEALVLSGAQYLLLHDLAPTPLVTVDRAGNICDVNFAAETMLGLERSQLLDRRVQSFLDAKHEALLFGLFAAGVAHGLEVTLIRDGAPLELLIDAVVLPGTVPARALLACVDFSARKRDEAARQLVNQRLHDAHRLESLEALAGGVAHNVNNLMTVVLAGAEQVLAELPVGLAHIEPLAEARQAARHAGDLAHQMLAFSGRVSVPVQPVDLGRMIRDLEPLLRASVQSKPVVVDLAERVPMVSGDLHQLRQAVLDLALNAAEALAGRDGVITIAVRVADQRTDGKPYVLVEVSDNGVGMTPLTRSRIFDPYFSTKSTGRGLGLAVVHGVVRAHGGEVSVTSDIGRGTNVSFQLPAVEDAPRVPVPPTEDTWQSGGTILVVDDDVTVRRVLDRALTKLGFTVVLSASAEEALIALREPSRTIRLLITDLTMPGMDGVALARNIRTDYPDLPIILITGYGELSAESGGLFTAALPKPFALSALADVLRTALSSR